MKWLKENYSVILGIAFLGICLVVGILSFIESNQPTPPPKNEKKCSQIIYFNKQKHNYDTTYTNAVFCLDSLVSFISPDGSPWSARDIVRETYQSDTDEDGNSSITDWNVTVNNGDRFSLSILQDEGCGIKSKMDSLIKRND